MTQKQFCKPENQWIYVFFVEMKRYYTFIICKRTKYELSKKKYDYCLGHQTTTISFSSARRTFIFKKRMKIQDTIIIHTNIMQFFVKKLMEHFL